MAQTIKLKRSAQSGASGIPSTSDLALGEVGINTYHGKMYIKKDDGTESIVEVGDTSGYLPLSGGTLTGGLSGTTASFSGAVTADGLTVDGDVDIGTDSATSSAKVTIQAQGANGSDETALVLRNYSASPYTGYVTQEYQVGTILMAEISARRISSTNGELIFRTKQSGTITDALNIASNGDISFYNSAGSSQNLFWDSSASTLGIGTTATNTLHGSFYGTTKLHIDGGTDRGQLIIQGDSLAQIVMSDNGATANSRVFITQVNDGVMNLKSVNDNGTSKATIMSMTSAGATTFSGSVTIDGTTKLDGGTGYFKDGFGNTFNSGWDVNADDFSTWINYSGYQGGSSKFRDLRIGNGKASTVVLVDGSSGNVNIGSSLMVGSTTAPSSRLHIKAADNNYTGGILIEDTDSLTKSGITHVNGGLYLSSNATNDHLEINSSGNATFSGDVTADKFKLSSTNFIDSPTTSIIRYSVGSGDHVFFSGSTSNSELLRINGSNANVNIPNGGLMVGATTAPTDKLEIRGNVKVEQTSNTDAIIKLNPNSGTIGSNYRWELVGGNSAASYGFQIREGTTPYLTINNSAGGNAGNATFSGAVTSTGLTVSTTYPKLQLNSTSGVARNFSVGTNNETFTIRNETASSDSLTISNANIVNIGSSLMVGSTTAPSANLEITQSGNNVGLLVTGGGYNYTAKFESADAEANIIIEDSNSTNDGNMIGVATNDMYFITNAAERFRINSDGSCRWTPDGTNHDMTLTADGNLLVGKTSAGFANTGHELRGGGSYAAFTRDGGTPVLVNRKSSDGTLVEYMKDGTSVGSIGTTSNGKLMMGVGGSSGTNLIFADQFDEIYPSQNGVTTLGDSGAKFKDLYLSGTANTAHVTSSGQIKVTGSNASGVAFSVGDAGTGWYNTGSNSIGLATAGSEKLRIDSSGNLLVGGTNSRPAEFNHPKGISFRGDIGQIQASTDGNIPLLLNRDTSDGDMIYMLREGTPVGSWKSRAGVVSTIVLDPRSGQGAGLTGAGAGSDTARHITPTNESGVEVNGKVSLGNSTNSFRDAYLSGCAKVPKIGATNTGIYFNGSFNAVVPYRPDTGVAVDDYLDLGVYSHRWDDIFATNGTIQTSDRNEKQDIESLTEAEERVAVAAKGLLKKFRWKSAVEDKGDDARIHFGIIAQDLQDAFEAEGLDAGRYGMFTSNTWTNEDGEEQTRMGVRYSELLAFIISAI